MDLIDYRLSAASGDKKQGESRGENSTGKSRSDGAEKIFSISERKTNFALMEKIDQAYLDAESIDL